jgi:hypothetical protein
MQILENFNSGSSSRYCLFYCHHCCFAPLKPFHYMALFPPLYSWTLVLYNEKKAREIAIICFTINQSIN